MMRQTAHERMQQHREKWHTKREAQENLLKIILDLQVKWIAAREECNAAHQNYKEAKAVWRTGCECNITDADNAAMMHKLKQL